MLAQTAAATLLVYDLEPLPVQVVSQGHRIFSRWDELHWRRQRCWRRSRQRRVSRVLPTAFGPHLLSHYCYLHVHHVRRRGRPRWRRLQCWRRLRRPRCGACMHWMRRRPPSESSKPSCQSAFLWNLSSLFVVRALESLHTPPPPPCAQVAGCLLWTAAVNAPSQRCPYSTTKSAWRQARWHVDQSDSVRLSSRLLGGAIAQRLQQALTSALHDGGSAESRDAAAAALGGLVAVLEGLASDVLRHRLAAPAALTTLRQLLSVMATAAGDTRDCLEFVFIQLVWIGWRRRPRWRRCGGCSLS